MDENPMFCYQCEQTAGGKGCTKMDICGKTAEIANL
jgi:hydroxylamine reductase